MLASDWSNDGESILGSCRFGPFGSVLHLRSSCFEQCELESVFASIASDPKRNLFNQRFSPDQRWITFLAHDLMYNATSTVYVIPFAGGAWRAMTDGARVRRQAALGT